MNRIEPELPFHRTIKWRMLPLYVHIIWNQMKWGIYIPLIWLTNNTRKVVNHVRTDDYEWCEQMCKNEQSITQYKAKKKLKHRLSQVLNWGNSSGMSGFDFIIITNMFPSGVVAAFMTIFIILVVKNRHDKHHIIDLEKKHQHEIDKVEASYAKTARQGYSILLADLILNQWTKLESGI